MTARAFFLMFFAAASAALPADPAPSVWPEQREIGQFAGLLRRSPFCVPTADESSPLAERFSLTGAVEMDGESQIFVLDKTTLTRLKVGTQTGPSGLHLVEILPNPDPRKIRATIRLGGETATISFAAAANPAPVAEGTAEKKPSAAAPAVAATAPAAEAKPESSKKSGRVIFRRPPISGNPTPAK